MAGLLVLAIVGLSLAALSLPGREQAQGLAALEDTTVDVTTLPQVLPFRMVAGHPVVEVRLPGSDEPVALILDSGAPVIISDAVAERFADASVGTATYVAVDGSVRTSAVVRLPELRLGGAVFRDVGAIRGYVGPDNPLSCISPNGLLGASLLKEAVWQIDYATGRLTIAESVSGLDHIEGAVTLEFDSPTGASPSPLIDIGVGEGSISVLLDTGSDGGVSVDPADLEAIGIPIDATAPAYDVQAAGATGTYSAQVRYVSADLALNAGLVLPEYPLATLDTLEAGQGNLGNAFLSDFVVTIDWPDGKLYLDPVAARPGPPLPFAATLGWDSERIVVGSVVSGSGPAADGLRVGQRISAVDGRDVSRATRDEFCGLITTGPTDSFELTTATGTTFQIGPVAGFFDTHE